ncbi:hypothetical protein HDU76_012369 [Blyttiomyces sp. JEL0837]|nr:hypothetical protein HDU76_012369 [Blyttiomyces sp. JEL0837]
MKLMARRNAPPPPDGIRELDNINSGSKSTPRLPKFRDRQPAIDAQNGNGGGGNEDVGVGYESDAGAAYVQSSGYQAIVRDLDADAPWGRFNGLRIGIDIPAVTEDPEASDPEVEDEDCLTGVGDLNGDVFLSDWDNEEEAVESENDVLKNFRNEIAWSWAAKS